MGTFGDDALMGVMQLAAAATPAVAGMVQGRKAEDAITDARKEALRYEKDLKQLEQNRQNIVNPFENVGVATKSAEMKMAQTDQSLANALDTIRATGGGAATATALARAAAQSKQQIAGDIQQQEINNQKLRAEGEKFAFEAQEERETAKLDRVSSQAEGYRQREMDAIAGQQAVKQAGLTGTTDILGSIMENPDAVKDLFAGFGGS